ncbi:MAG: glycoside hydrolase family 108 protein [Stellaceae bacterium]
MSTDDPLFQAAMAIVYQHECGNDLNGALHDDPADPGGLTRFGLALKEHPELTADVLRALTRDQADAIYYATYWSPHQWAALPTTIAIKAFDISVNTGAGPAIKALQRALRACGVAGIADDGELGPVTIAAAQRPMSIELLAALRSECAGYYRLVAERRPLAAKELPGWLNRAYS